MKAIGIVTKTQGNTATVVSRRSSACSSCHDCEAKGACHAELIFGSQTETVEIVVDNSVGAEYGDTVELESSTKITLAASFAFFVLPFIVTLIFYFVLKNQLSDSSVFPLVLILLFIVSFFVIGKILNVIFSKRQTVFIATILEESKEHLEAE